MKAVCARLSRASPIRSGEERGQAQRRPAAGARRYWLAAFGSTASNAVSAQYMQFQTRMAGRDGSAGSVVRTYIGLLQFGQIFGSDICRESRCRDRYPSSALLIFMSRSSATFWVPPAMALKTCRSLCGR